jgi:hypothetical protein
MSTRRVEAVESLNPIVIGDDAQRLFTLVLNGATTTTLDGDVYCTIVSSEQPDVAVVSLVELEIQDGGVGRTALLTLTQAQTELFKAPANPLEALDYYADVVNVDSNNLETTYGPFILPFRKRISNPS